VIERRRFFEQLQRDIEQNKSRIRALIEEGDTLARQGESFQAFRRYLRSEAELVENASSRAKADFVLKKVDAEKAADLGAVFRKRREQEARIDLYLVLRHEVTGARVSLQAIEEELVAALRRATFGFEIKSLTGKFTGRRLEDLAEDPGPLRKEAASGSRASVVLLCLVATAVQDVEHGFASARSTGWVRLLGLRRGELLLSVSSESADTCKKVNIPRRKDEMAAESAACLAELLASRLFDQL
jgi:hypothetical protein